MRQSAGNFHRPSLTDVAYRELRSGILRGALPPGKKLIVNELVDEWNISGTPIKEALNRLVADELVEALPRRGIRVRTYAPGEMREIFELRALHEVHCVGHLAGIIAQRQDAVARLQNLLDESRTVAAAGPDVNRLFDLDSAFHEYIVEQCGNRTLINNFNRLHAHSLAIGSALGRNCSLERWHTTRQEHACVLDGIEQGHAGNAGRAMRVHLEATCAALLDYYAAGRKSGRTRTRNALAASP